MHILASQSGTIDDGAEPCDLGQRPGDIVLLSAADTELALLADAYGRWAGGGERPTLRLANLLQLKHNFSVDLYLEQTLSGVRLVVVRLLGGRSYWAYGVERLAAAAGRGAFQLACLPGDDKPDATLEGLSTVSEPARSQLWGCLTDGGPENATRFLETAAAIIDGGPLPPAPSPVLRAGLHHPATGVTCNRPCAAILFYRALYQSGDLDGVDTLANSLADKGITALPVYLASLRDPASLAFLRETFARHRPEIILNTTAFASSPPGDDAAGGPLAEFGVPVLQTVLSSETRSGWAGATRGLSARDIAMHVALPEVDGRLLTRAVAFKADAAFDEATQHYVVRSAGDPERAAFVADLAAAWIRLARTPVADRRIAVVLANYPNRDSRLANGVGLDTPASATAILDAMRHAGYRIGDAPSDGNALIDALLAGPTNAGTSGRTVQVSLKVADYRSTIAELPLEIVGQVEDRWGSPEQDPMCHDGIFALPVRLFANVAVAIQPARGYNIDPKSSYHDPALVPPHNYLAFYVWLRRHFDAHAVVHLGKHGNLEWLPGKALALSATCYPEAVLGPVPNIYPFIVNDPGEGAQAKRRSAAVIIDHLMPPMTRAESYGPLAELEHLVDEYAQAAPLDARRRDHLAGEILATAARLGLDKDLGLSSTDVTASDVLSQIDNHLCDLKEMQIRDGLHVFGKSPEGTQRRDTLVALARVPRGEGHARDRSLLRALAADLGLDGFDPLTRELAAPWRGPRPAVLEEYVSGLWRTAGDTVELLEALAADLVSGTRPVPVEWSGTTAVLSWIRSSAAPRLDTSGRAEIAGLLQALDGRFVRPGPSGAPTRGRPDVLPTGRNFYSLDSRTLPTPAAWELGRRSAEQVIERYTQDHGDWPRAIALSAWGTSNMRTGGDDIAQAMALMGARPTWDPTSGRVLGFEVIPIARLGRPRVDVTFRMSGFFRDAFPAQVALLDSAVRALAGLDETDEDNPIAASARADEMALLAEGHPQAAARRLATARVFGSAPGAYGAGLQALIDEGIWQDRADLAEAYLTWGRYAYGASLEGAAHRQLLQQRLGAIDAVLHNQDNREHDILDSDDYYQFAGGLAVTIETLRGAPVRVYHNDHSRPEAPVVRALEEEIGRVVRGRAANPKWLAGIMRHGYKGAFEIAATVDYLYAFAATTRAVGDHHFDTLYDAYLGDQSVLAFLAKNNEAALRDIAARFHDAIERGFWQPRRNSVPGTLARLAASASAGDTETTG